MKLLYTILFILLCSTCRAQCPVRYDTVPVQLIDGVRLYNYYNSNGSLAWGAVKQYDTTLIPKGGTFTYYAQNNRGTFKKGYRVYITSADCKMTIVAYLDDRYRIITTKGPQYDAVIIF